MKDIYSKENIKLVLLNTKRRFKNLYNRDYSIDDLVRAFNSLSSKHQDLLLKINKNENDKAMLRVTYDNMYKFLVYSLPEIKKEERARINIKSLKSINNMNLEEGFSKKKEYYKKHIEEVLYNVDMPEDDKFVILYKYEDGEEKNDLHISSSMGLELRVISEIVSRFWSIVRDDYYKKEKKLINKKN